MSAKQKQGAVLICWNKSEYVNDIKTQIEKGFDVKLCLNHSEFKQLDNELLSKKENDITFNSKITYVITLCELKWSHKIEESAYADMKGIELAQYMRLAGVKVPILFVSFLSRKMILDKHPDAEIIRTPALKHGFCRLPSKINEWKDILKDLTINKELKNAIEKCSENEKSSYISKELTKLELKYTQQRFCKIKGLLEQINHDISSCSTKEKLTEKLKILRFADESENYQSKSDIDDLEIKINNSTEDNLKEDNFRQKIHDDFKKVCILYSAINQEKICIFAEKNI